MGKSKRRILTKNNIHVGNVLKRDEIINTIISDLRQGSLSKETKKLISLFGITLEEFAEAGATIEELAIVEKMVY